MTTDIVKRTQRSILIPNHENRLPRDFCGQECPRLGDGFRPPDHLPGTRKNRSTLGFVDVGDEVPRIGNGPGSFERQRAIEGREQI